MKDYSAFGGHSLGSVQATRRLDALTDQIRQVDAVLEAQRRAEMNEDIYIAAIRAWFRRTDPVQDVDKESGR